MDRINSPVLVVLFLILTFASCRSYKPAYDTYRITWKEAWIYKFIDEYVDYEFKYKSMCADDKRDFFYDFSRKIQSIREYPFAAVIDSVQQFAIANRIEFDSVLMENLSDPIFETIDYSCPNTYFSFVRKGKVITYVVGLDFCETVLYIESIERNIKVASTKKDGCEIGYSSYTWFDKHWNWRIDNIIINPTGIRNSD